MTRNNEYNFASRIQESRSVPFEITKWNSPNSFTVRELIVRTDSNNRRMLLINTAGYEQVVSKVDDNWMDKYGNNFVLTSQP